MNNMSLTTPMKIIIAILLIGLIGAGFYVLDYKAKWDDLNAKSKELADSQAQLLKIQEEIKALPELTRQVEQKEREMKELVSTSQRTGGATETPELFVANYIQEIERMVISQQESTGDYDFDIVSITPGSAGQAAPAGDSKAAPGAPPPPEGGGTPEALQGFPTRVFNMNMTGKYSTLIDFLYQLGAMKLDRLVTINRISLAPGKSEGNASPVLTVTLPITAYMKTGN
jgi:Tfp pilus assembly protein PilO